MKISTIFLKTALIVIGFVLTTVLFFFTTLLLSITLPHNVSLSIIVPITTLISTLLIWWVLTMAWRLLSQIGTSEPFVTQTIAYLRNISIAAWIISGLFLISSPAYYLIADVSDAPGILVIVFAIIALATTVAIFGLVLRQLFSQALTMKNELDLLV